jgi:hypothetical protein
MCFSIKWGDSLLLRFIPSKCQQEICIFSMKKIWKERHTQPYYTTNDIYNNNNALYLHWHTMCHWPITLQCRYMAPNDPFLSPLSATLPLKCIVGILIKLLFHPERCRDSSSIYQVEMLELNTVQDIIWEAVIMHKRLLRLSLHEHSSRNVGQLVWENGWTHDSEGEGSRNVVIWWSVKERWGNRLRLCGM